MCSIEDQDLSDLGLLKKKKGLKKISLNVRSLVPKLEQIELLLSNEKLDLLILTESWVKPWIVNNMVRLDNYKVYRWDRELNKKEEGSVYANKRVKVDAQFSVEIEKIDRDMYYTMNDVP